MFERSTWAVTLATALAASSLGGCAEYGPQQVRPARADYAQSLARSSAEQLLLNLVRLRYRDNPVFLELDSIVTHYVNTRTASLAGKAFSAGRSPAEVDLGASYQLVEEPTITYSPLKGEDFVKRLLLPLDPAVVVYLAQTGWSIERLMLCCVQKVNGLHNPTSAAEPNPDYEHGASTFSALAADLRRLQSAGLLELESAEGRRIQLRLEHSTSPDLEAVRAEVCRVLGLDPSLETVEIVPALSTAGKDEIAVTGRSMLATLYSLAQAVEAPSADVVAGRIGGAGAAGEDVASRAAALARLITIHSATERPLSAAVAVAYRGSWFYIADDDLNSKTTFGLLSLLSSLKEASGDAKSPLLTLGVR